MAVLFRSVSRLIFLASLLAAPWLFGGRPLESQVWLAGGLGLAFVTWLLSAFMDWKSGAFAWNAWTGTFALLIAGWVTLAILQLALPARSGVPQFAGLPSRHAVAEGIPPRTDGVWPTPATPHATQVPALTRLQVARWVWPLVALLLAAHLCSVPEYRYGFWMLLAINAACLSVFGIVQKLTWNERIYWAIPLEYGGQPFASFVNRNHAAGYLNLALAAALGLLGVVVREAHRGHAMPVLDQPRSLGRIRFVQLLLLVITAGVVATLSRGGQLAAVVAAGGAMLLATMTTPRRTMVRPLGLALLAGFLVAASVGAWELARGRLGELDWRALRGDARWWHWRDMAAAFPDLWTTGTGLGTYRFVNPPYKNHVSTAMYWNADNQYLELFVEGGVVAAMLMGLGILACLVLVHRAYYLDFDDAADSADLGPIALMVLLSQGLQGATDYGPGIMAQLLTTAAMLGAVGSGCRFADLQSGARSWSQLPLQRWLLWPVGLVGLMGGAAWYELRSAAAADTFLQRLPELDDPRHQDWTTLTIDTAIAQGARLASLRPDDPAVHRALGQLRVIRYRLQSLERLLDEAGGKSSLTPDALWPRTQLARLDQLAVHALTQGDPDVLETLRAEPIVRENLAAAYQDFRRVKQHRVYDSYVDLRLAYLAGLYGAGIEERHDWLRSAVYANPSDLILLGHVATIAEPVSGDLLAVQCWRRWAALDPERADEIYRRALTRFPPRYVMEHVVPQEVSRVLDFAEQIDDPTLERQAVERVEQLLKTGQAAPSGESWMQLARLATLQGDPAAALQHYQEALRLEPLKWDWRVQYTELLLEQRRYKEAHEQVEFGLMTTPDRREFANLRERIQAAERPRIDAPSALPRP